MKRSVGMSVWLKYKGRIWLALLLAIPILLVFLPPSYRRALDILFDALSVALFVTIAALLGWGLVRDIKTVRPIGYLFGAMAMAFAFVSIWNFIALYMPVGSTPVTVFGWDFSARPTFYWLPVLFLVFSAVAFARLRGTRSSTAATASDPLGNRPPQ
jgi:hypothetical protein